MRAAINVGNIVLAKRGEGAADPTGITVDLVRELGKRLGVPVEFVVYDLAGKVSEAANTGAWDICFLAIEPARAAEVEFTAPYVLIEGTYLVAKDSPLKTAADVDAPDVRIGVRKGDAGEFFLTRTLKNATLLRDDAGSLEDAARQLRAGAISAYAANRHRLTGFVATTSGYRILEGNFYPVEQAIAVRKGNTVMLGVLNTFLDQARVSGLIATSIRQAGLSGVDVAPAPVARKN